MEKQTRYEILRKRIEESLGKNPNEYNKNFIYDILEREKNLGNISKNEHKELVSLILSH